MPGNPQNRTPVSNLLRTVASYLQPEMARNPNTAIAEVLDREEHPLNGNGVDQSEEQPAKELSSSDFYEEHQARLNAESEAAHSSRRLAVAQEQVAEYAAQRQAEAGRLLEQVEAALGKLTASEDDCVGSLLQGLRQQLAESAAEAAAFSAQQNADAERTKRSFSQANLASQEDGNGDIEMKRLREDTPTPSDSGMQEEEGDQEVPITNGTVANGAVVRSFTDRARYIPLRLSSEERRLLRLLEAALSVSEYTDKVDIQSWRSKNGRIHAQIKDMCGILCGLVLAQNYKAGQQLVTDRDFSANAHFFQDCFEVGRRYKIMNPDKMRAEYGKLIYLLMDTAEPSIKSLLDFNAVRPLRTVYSLLEEREATHLLTDPMLERATAEIQTAGKSRPEIQRDIKAKERARDTIARRYRSNLLKEEEILLCLYSISDNNSFLLFNRDPIDRMIAYLKSYFRPDQVEHSFSLGINTGMQGARLTHNHERQYHYVLQSLTLWREISHDMFRLWYLAESDLLREGNTYRLTNTGQGMNRVQQAPSTMKAMLSVLAKCQQKLGSWVGSAVIHMGDHNVPNALMFIDKVPRILNPVVQVLDALPELCKDPHAEVHVKSIYGSLENCRKSILLDFFRHAFDGSGADNFFDAGSCIDGRLTSAWNWGSKIEKKPYYNLFKMAGFSGFDGKF